MIERLGSAGGHGVEQAILWRFMDFTKYVAMLHRRALFFARSDRLPDPFEGHVPGSGERSHWSGPSHVDDALRRRVCVSSWHENEHESAAMWRIYLHSADGLAIRSRASAIESALADARERLYLGSVRYVDYREEGASVGDELGAFFCKRKSYDYEREVRVVWRADAPLDEPGHYIRADLARLIEQVVIAPTAASWFAELVHSVTEKYGLRLPVATSSLLEPPDADPRCVSKL